MNTTINRGAILWAVGVMQPVSAVELTVYLRSALTQVGQLPTGMELHKFLLEASDAGQLVRVRREPDLFSLSAQGNDYLTKDQRRARDRERIFLLRDSWPGRSVVSRGEMTSGLGGAAPPQIERLVTEGSGANKFGPCVPRVQTYWPRYSRQLIEKAGPSSSSRDDYLELLSFNSLTQLNVARGIAGEEALADYNAIGLMLGISPRLINQMTARPARHYRLFPLPKRGGGERQIEAPRVFLKVVQKFIADYILRELPVHVSVHSFSHKRSILTNAEQHLRHAWVANIDIADFFGSITTALVEGLLRSNGFDEASCRAVSKLTTNNGHLPQGAPSSPIISNALLFTFDSAMKDFADARILSYTRYADDITISGHAKDEVLSAISYAQALLMKNFGLRLRTDKTRVISGRSQQRVTGVVVNDIPLPPRKLRRNIRAAAFNASKTPVKNSKTVEMLRGYLSYFKSFPDFRDNVECHNLSRTIEAIVRAHRLSKPSL